MRTLETYSQAMCAPPSCATESSPYSLKTFAYSFSARSTPTDEATALDSRQAPGELVEEQPPQGLGRARIPREQRALDGFRQVRQRKDMAVEV